jgi:hypothetical protein
MGDSDNVRRLIWQAVSPSISPHGGTCHVITTGRGPENAAAELWYKAKSGDEELFPLFIPYWSRPGRDGDWKKREQGKHTKVGFKQEYPATEKDALMGDDEYWFTEWLDLCYFTTDKRVHPTEYFHGWDIAEVEDKAATVVLNGDLHAVDFWSGREKYADLKQRIETQWQQWGGIVQIEANGPGRAVGGLVNIPEDHLLIEATTGISKTRMKTQAKMAVQHGFFKFDQNEWPELDTALQHTRDDAHTPDETMAMMEAIDCVLNAPRPAIVELGGAFRRQRLDQWDRWR